MKQVNILLLIMMFFIIESCSISVTAINVTKPQINIPENSKFILPNTSLDTITNIFKNNAIMYTRFEGGVETEELFLDDYTRAKYKVYESDSEIKILCFWGITQKLKSKMIVWGGSGAASAYDVNAWDMIKYSSEMRRPARVFKHMVNLLDENNVELKFHN